MTTAPAANYDDLDRADETRRARLEAPNALVDAALWYAASGWPVFPLRPGDKGPVIRRAHPDDDELQDECQGKCGQEGHGLYDATVDLNIIRDWWRRWPQANIGTRTGLRFDVIDVDGPAGFRSLADMRHINCPPDCCTETTCPGSPDVLGLEVLAKAYTGGGGRHILVIPTGQRNGAKLMPGIDYRGEGGYIVLPPSRHESGRRYDWLTPPDERLLSASAAA